MGEHSASPVAEQAHPRWRLSRAKRMLLSALLVLIVLYIAAIRPYWHQMSIFLMVDAAQGEVTAEQAGPEWLRTGALGRHWMRGFDTIREVNYGSPEPGETRQLLVKLKNCDTLQTLFLWAPEACDDELGQLGCLPTLQVLSFNGMLTDGGMAHVSRCRSLEILILEEAMITDQGLHRLGPLPNLTRLVLRNCSQITNEGLVKFGRFPRLDDLAIQACPQVTDAGLAHLGQITGLRKVYLEGAQFTDRAIAHFAENEKLAFVGFSDTRVTAAGIAEFRTAHPGCALYVDGAQVAPPIGGPVSGP